MRNPILQIVRNIRARGLLESVRPADSSISLSPYNAKISIRSCRKVEEVLSETLTDDSPVDAALECIRRELIDQFTPQGHWVGELSSSALSTATAISALALVACDLSRDEQTEFADLIQRARGWLVAQQRPDGGWGDTPRSLSNIATSMLVVAAFDLAERVTESPANIVEARNRGQDYIAKCGGVAALKKRYGRDKTFAVPILMNCALAGQVPWEMVSALPFELACFPQAWYRWLQLPVVSYAIPALVACGQAIFFHRPPRNPVTRAIRSATIKRSLRVLGAIQPASGGYLEAIPLTSFVVMSLASTGRREHPVTQAGLRFLKQTIREEGSWPIDTNLATWVTSLAIHALDDQAYQPTFISDARTSECWSPKQCLIWLLKCQHTERHPFTGADPGGWGWTDLSGAVPDADDTPGAMLALRRLLDRTPNVTKELRSEVQRAVQFGCDWLLGLQNRDGGWPTFCKGWGKLPFDRSGSDLTAHVLRAFSAWQADLGPTRNAKVEKAMLRGWSYLQRTQNKNGSWTPLWFGNQFHELEENPIYGTAKVLLAYVECGRLDNAAVPRALEFLYSRQSAAGGWGREIARQLGKPAQDEFPVPSDSIEETSLVVEVFARWQTAIRKNVHSDELPSQIRQFDEALRKGVAWLSSAVESGQHRNGSPIGLYFAKLWYDEKLYPLTFAMAALRAASSNLRE